MILTEKQTTALDYLEDLITNELLFGGGAGGAKTVLGCYWTLKNCFKYPGSRWVIGRAKLKTLRDTTLKSFFEVVKMQGIPFSAFTYNQTSSVITFFNGSEIYLKDLFLYPSDPDFDELGSLEITGSFIDEASQITNKAKNILMSRTRYKLDEFGLIPKMLLTTNPTRGWIYEDYYKPHIDGKLKPNRKFIQSLWYDNPNLSDTYEATLDSLDMSSRKRLKLGDWNYIDDPSLLVEYDAVDDLFTNEHIVRAGVKRLGADIAMQGRDKYIAMLEQGLVIEIVAEQEKSDGKGIEKNIRSLTMQHGVGRTNVIADSDGMGAYLESYIKNIKTFHGNGKTIGSDEFNNLKSQCGFKLAEVINARKMLIVCTDEQKVEIKAQIVNCLKRDRIDIDDTKKKLISKEKMKKALGRSPDYLDVLLMLMVYQLRGSRRTKMTGSI